MTPEEKARQVIDQKLIGAGWAIQDLADLNVTASLGVAVREFPTSTGPVDYALFVDGSPVGVRNNPAVMRTASSSMSMETTRSASPMRQPISWFDSRITRISSTGHDAFFLSSGRRHLRTCLRNRTRSATI